MATKPKIQYDIPCVVCTHNRNTAIVVGREEDVILYIPLVGEDGFELERQPATEFSKLYDVLADYPAARAAQLYAGYAQSLGASKEVMDHLGQIVKLSPKEIEMATAKKTAAKKAAPSTDVKTKAPKAAKPAAKPTAKKEPGEKRESAAQMFKDLIMAGNLTDAKIFEKVQAKFGLDDSKASYVKWYRNDLAKRGMKPPEAKG